MMRSVIHKSTNNQNSMDKCYTRNRTYVVSVWTGLGSGAATTLAFVDEGWDWGADDDRTLALPVTCWIAAAIAVDRASTFTVTVLDVGFAIQIKTSREQRISTIAISRQRTFTREETLLAHSTANSRATPRTRAREHHLFLAGFINSTLDL